jgi:hypothetical protein
MRQYSGVGVSELLELRQLLKENGRLKRLVAHLSTDRQIQQENSLKKAVRPRARRKLARWAAGDLQNQRAACGKAGAVRDWHAALQSAYLDVTLVRSFHEIKMKF